MPWCPSCKDEFRDEFTTCPVCGAALTEPPAPMHENEKELRERNAPALLTTVPDAMTARMLESKLESCGIPAMIKYKGSGEYLQIYMGGTPFGVDLYVPQSALERAREVLDPGDAGELQPDEADAPLAESEPEEQDRPGGLPQKSAVRTLWGFFFLLSTALGVLGLAHSGVDYRVSSGGIAALCTTLAWIVIQFILGLNFLFRK